MTDSTELTPADLDRLEDLLTPCESGCPSCYGNMDRGFGKKTCRALVAGYRRMLALEVAAIQIDNGYEHCAFCRTSWHVGNSKHRAGCILEKPDAD